MTPGIVMPGTRVLCDKNSKTNNSIELGKCQIHSDITLTVKATSEFPKSHHKIQISYRKKERSVGIAKHSIFFLGTRRRGTRM